jgi:acyl-CoA synthetase (AMP-forming)/AMP-acid ligase II
VSSSSANANIARHLTLMAESQPQTPALKVPRGRTASGDIDYLSLTFAELAAEATAWRACLTARGVRRGDRTLVMVRPGLPLIASVFALFQIGAVPVIIDPGMGLKNFLRAVAHSRPRALVGVPFARLVSRIFRTTFRTVEVRVPASGSLVARLVPAKSEILDLKSEIVGSAADDLAAILFTSGSTGAPKGVCYEHGMFDAQVRLIRETYNIQPGEIDLPLLPIFALFNPALGLTTIVPEIDPRRPAEVDPAKIVQAIRQEKVTTSFGSPTLWRKIGDHCVATQTPLPGLRRVLCAGAPVPAMLWEASRIFLPNGQLHSPYGATEALPVSSISAEEVALVRGAGACVGRPVAGIEVSIIDPVDGPIASLAGTRERARGEIGEIVVTGPVVTKTYDDLPSATASAKIVDGSRVWHRMGDCGYLDADGRIWFCGRKVERVETPVGMLYTEPCEQVFRVHSRATRCALIGLGERGQQRPALVVEAQPNSEPEARALAGELRALARQYPATAMLEVFFFHPKFPVDVRHNAKIHRLTLAQWAATAKAYRGDSLP